MSSNFDYFHRVLGNVADGSSADAVILNCVGFGDDSIESALDFAEAFCKTELIFHFEKSGFCPFDGIANTLPCYAEMLGDFCKRKVIIVDPMLATGGSAIAAVDFVKKRGAKDISLMFLIAAPEGIEALTAAHPDVDIYIAAKDDHLNENAYIVPGLGDAGDRIFGTK